MIEKTWNDKKMKTITKEKKTTTKRLNDGETNTERMRHRGQREYDSERTPARGPTRE